MSRKGCSFRHHEHPDRRGKRARLPPRRGPRTGLACQVPAARCRRLHRLIGPAWTERGRAPQGYFTQRSAEAWLREVFSKVRNGTLPGLVQTGVTVEQAAEEFLRYVEHERERKASTVRDYRSAITTHILPVFGSVPVEDVTTEQVELWLAQLGGRGRPLSNRQRAKTLTIFHGVMERARRRYKLSHNPIKDVEKPRSSPRVRLIRRHRA
ncbi:MAG: hypothetical protein ACR2NB_07840 [Solirubrobacteraceae bacterium]